ncbi:MAG TPA: type II secretion system F family protein [Pirellulaceae bacterium]|jgi:type IV pilus assembly protein PilC|nr:type II secretion system F family protein [Pirellulaceae bacterium]
MPTFQFEAMDATGAEIRDVIEAATEEEAQGTIRQMGYFVTKISVKKSGAQETVKKKGRKKSFAIGGGGTKFVCAFTRQLSILQDAGLPILRSLKILENNAKPGKLKNSLMDVCEEIETGSTLSEAMAKSPKVFNRLYINMIKAGEAGGALEVILQRLAEFMERAESLKKKVKGAMIYPVVVIMVAVSILIFIMLKIVPVFAKMFDEFELELPAATLLLVAISDFVVGYWFLLPAIPVSIWLFIKLARKFKHGRMGWDMYVLKLPVMGNLIEKNILARTTRTLGTLISSGVPILEALNITRETAGNALFERMYGKVTDSIRDGNTVARPLAEYSRLGFHPVCAMFWFLMGATPGILMICLTPMKDMGFMLLMGTQVALGAGTLSTLFYASKIKTRVVDDLVVNMVDVGEETGELDTMLYKVADQFDEEVKTLTDGLMALLEPLMIVFLGGAVGFIVISLFMPLVALIQGLS